MGKSKYIIAAGSECDLASVTGSVRLSMPNARVRSGVHAVCGAVHITRISRFADDATTLVLDAGDGEEE